MPDYQNGQLYALKRPGCDDVYIGSTTMTLAARIAAHRQSLKTNRGTAATSMLQHGDCYIELIEAYPCETKQQLLARERELIQTTAGCINRNLPGRTTEQWRIDNAERYKATQHDYYLKNKEKYLARERARQAKLTPEQRTAINAKKTEKRRIRRQALRSSSTPASLEE